MINQSYSYHINQSYSYHKTLRFPEQTDLLADLLVDRLALFLPAVLEALLLVGRLAVLLGDRAALLKEL